MTRTYGYTGTDHILELYRQGVFEGRLMAAAHLMQGSSEGRFTITYATKPEYMSREEIEGVGYNWADYDEITKRYDPEKLKEGCSQVIFPEHYDEHNNIVHDFQDKFVDLARFYYKKTGVELDFVPLYVAPRLKKLFLGDPIHFHADAPIAEERRRICDALMDAITDIAVKQPKHTVVPYPNIPKSQYPQNIPLEVYSNEKPSV